MNRMKPLKFLLVTAVFFLGLQLGLWLTKADFSFQHFDADQLSANLARVWTQPKKTEPILENYPFPLLSPPVTIAEGFEAYDGNLKDPPGAFHWAIDYVQKSGDSFLPFPVFSAHNGIAFQGEGKTWGKFVIVRKRLTTNQGYNTLYAHLDAIPNSIPVMRSDIDNSKGIFLAAGSYLGQASTTGNAQGIPQLHFEFHIVNQKTGTTLRTDPYGVYKRLGSGLYPQPGSSLKGLPHYWKADNPPFAAE